jgi:hypothetical protein
VFLANNLALAQQPFSGNEAIYRNAEADTLRGPNISLL